MHGLQAIDAHNGWAIAALGISIVFTGLTLLSIAISQLHKLLEAWKNRREIFKRLKDAAGNGKTSAPVSRSDLKRPDIEKALGDYRLLTERIGEPFSLPRLLEFALKMGLSRPHFMINKFLKAGIMAPDGQGLFRWKD